MLQEPTEDGGHSDGGVKSLAQEIKFTTNENCHLCTEENCNPTIWLLNQVYYFRLDRLLAPYRKSSIIKMAGGESSKWLKLHFQVYNPNNIECPLS